MTGPIPDVMRAAWIERLGPPEEIRHGELPVPPIGPTDVLVAVEAVAVNPVDLFVRSGAFPTPLNFPFVIGRDLVGTVAATGSSVVGFETGTPVWCNSLGHGGRQGAAARYAAVAADRLYAAPAGIDPASLVALLHPGATAYLALSRHGRLRAGETALIVGGAGHVGRAATVMAKAAGARVIVTAGASDLDACRALGADLAFDYRDPDLFGLLREACPDGVDLHLDTSGHHDLETALLLTAPRARVIVMAGGGEQPELPIGPLYTSDKSLIGFAISNATTVELAVAAARVNQLVATGALRPAAVQELPLSDAAEAHRRLASGEARGTRLVLRP